MTATPNKSRQQMPVEPDDCTRAPSAWHCCALRSVKTISTIAVVISVLVFIGCSEKQADRLLGTWQSQLIPSEWGSNRITMTFFADGRTAGTNAFLEGKNWLGMAPIASRAASFTTPLKVAFRKI